MKDGQTSLPLMISERTVLVTLDTVRACRGIDTESVLALVDSGVIRWVWDIACHTREAKVCEYRVWGRELLAPGSSGQIGMDQAIDAVIGTQRERLRRNEVARILLCSRPHIHRLVEAGSLVACPSSPKNHITRASLDAFLRSRLLNQ